MCSENTRTSAGTYDIFGVEVVVAGIIKISVFWVVTPYPQKNLLLQLSDTLLS
jgi:hypothetical protein